MHTFGMSRLWYDVDTGSLLKQGKNKYKKEKKSLKLYFNEEQIPLIDIKKEAKLHISKERQQQDYQGFW